jgi:hypothetical protein
LVAGVVPTTGADSTSVIPIAAAAPPPIAVGCPALALLQCATAALGKLAVATTTSAEEDP